MATESKDEYISITFSEDDMNLNIHCTWAKVAHGALLLLVKLYGENPGALKTVLSCLSVEINSILLSQITTTEVN
jgi:hypothetical protein